MHNSTFVMKLILKLLVKYAVSRKKIMQVLLPHCSVNWINPGYQCVPLFIKSSKLFVSNPISKLQMFFLVVVTKQHFSVNFPFLRSSETSYGGKLYRDTFIVNTMCQDLTLFYLINMLFGAYFNPPRGCMGQPTSLPTTPEHMLTHWSAPLHRGVGYHHILLLVSIQNR